MDQGPEFLSKENTSEDNEKIKIQIPKMVFGSASDVAGEQGVIYSRIPNDPNVLGKMMSIGSSLQSSPVPLAILKHEDNNVVFVVMSPSFSSPVTSRQYGQVCMTWLPNQTGNAGNIFSQFKPFRQYLEKEISKKIHFDELEEVEIYKKEEEVSKVLLNKIKDCIKESYQLIIEWEESDFLARGNDVMDTLIIKQLCLVYDNLNSDEKKKFSFSFRINKGASASVAPVFKEAVVWVGAKLNDFWRKEFEKGGSQVLKLSEVM
jgi:hypothetical protein